MCREHQLLQHLATTHGNTRVCVSSTKAFGLVLGGVSVELREQACEVGGTIWSAVRREA